jgi:hypothetical protein
VATILVGVLKCRTQFWKRTTQESIQQSLVEIGSVVSEDGSLPKMCLPVLPFYPFFFTCNFEVNLIGCGDHLGRCSEMPDTILEEDHPRIISANFG